MDRAETIVASKRVADWPEEARKWLDALPEDEREVVLLLAAHLGATPIEETEEEA